MRFFLIEQLKQYKTKFITFARGAGHLRGQMSNIVNLFKTTEESVAPSRKVIRFLQTWGKDVGADTESRKFKLMLAGIQAQVDGYFTND